MKTKRYGNIKKISLNAVAFLMVIVVGLFFLYQHEKSSKSVAQTKTRLTTITPVRPLQSFTLVDDQGHSFTTTQLKGHWSFLFFGYTHCPDICPTSLAELSLMYSQLAVAREPLPQVVFISIDPKRDTPAQLHQYVRSFHSQFIGLTGDLAQVAQLTKQVGISAMKNLNHSGTIVVVDPNAQIYGFFTIPHKAKRIARDYTQLIHEVKA